MEKITSGRKDWKGHPNTQGGEKPHGGETGHPKEGTKSKSNGV